MNKTVVSREIGYAYDVLTNCEIAVKGEITKTFRSQISSFGAAIIMGSLLPAVAFFSDQGGASVERQKLMNAILQILKDDGVVEDTYETLFEYIRDTGDACKENIVNAAIALKLAMNLYTLR